ncbi:MAG: COX15/CtaA family protein [Gemmatimonadaceae bacterium]
MTTTNQMEWTDGMNRMNEDGLAPGSPRGDGGDDGREDARAVGRWLVAFAVMILAIIIVGGATRLTESGLSITEWKPVSGVVPPLTEAAWQAEFARYQRIPQYARLNAGMTLDAFKGIYLWEYGHRLIARLVGLAFVLPLAWFTIRRRLPRRARGPVYLLLVLLLVQAAMGWWMVKSGLSVRTEVSQYRLATHLTSALVILALTIWTAADLLEPRRRGPSPAGDWRPRALDALLALVFVTAGSGALVAGLRAGKIYNTFPLMGGRLVPAEYAQLAPWWRNLFENPAAVQFDHRLLATTTFVIAVALWAVLRRSTDRRFAARMHLVLGAAMLQLTLGIATLLLGVPIILGVAHQGGAALMMTAVLLARHASVAAGPAAGRVPAAAGATAWSPV